MNKKILIVDDEMDTIEFIEYNLKKEGFTVITAMNGRDAIEMAKEHNPDLILLDVMMPELDGIETCRELRTYSEFKDTSIIFLTARAEDYSQIAGFDAGGDDYIIKTVRPSVLIARIKAFLRRNDERSNASNEDIIELQDLSIDKEKYELFQAGIPVNVTKKEFQILHLFASKPGKVFSREEIYNKIWGYSLIVGDRTIDVHIRKLREKIGEQYIKTVKGVGYKAIE